VGHQRPILIRVIINPKKKKPGFPKQTAFNSRQLQGKTGQKLRTAFQARQVFQVEQAFLRRQAKGSEQPSRQNRPSRQNKPSRETA
jgi:hypothetical protein